MIACNDVWKGFRRHTGPKLIRDHVRSRLRRSPAEVFWAVRGVSFTVAEGESFGILGRNGAGKSTLLALIAGIAPPDRGGVQVKGRVAPLLELGSGFHPDLTGRENVFLNASLLGVREDEAKRAFDAIVDFSGIESFIDEPLRTYSSGMIVRLAFSVAVHSDPEVLIVDEVLSVGDQAFSAKCLDRILELRRAGKTFLCVSHSRAMLTSLCDRALWLDHGEVVQSGPILDVVSAYEREIAQPV